MGLYDRIHAECPNCGATVEFQSKALDCMMDVFTLENAPVEVVYDTMNDPHKCTKCGEWCALHDPEFPPGRQRPRPNLSVVKVVAPKNSGDNGGSYQWWPDDEPFTVEHIIK